MIVAFGNLEASSHKSPHASQVLSSRRIPLFIPLSPSYFSLLDYVLLFVINPYITAFISSLWSGVYMIHSSTLFLFFS